MGRAPRWSREMLDADIARALGSADVDVVSIVRCGLAGGRTPGDLAGEIRQRLGLSPSTARELVGRLVTG